MGIRPVSEAVHARKSSGQRLAALEENIDLADMRVGADTVLAAAKAGALVAAMSVAAAAAAVWAFVGTGYIIPSVFALVALPLLVSEALKTYPASAASRRAARVLKSSASAANLMVMSLRHEPSLSKAMRFASRGDDEFAMELRRGLWEVVMGRHEGFEAAVHSLGVRWSRFGDDLKTSLNAMVTASCESTEDGKRRALDRASGAMVAGAKRRIEEYALSLSTPSMVMFGLGILLPLMVGSFLPMMSWDIWSGAPETLRDAPSQGGVLPQTVFLMNVLFPAVAWLVASDAISRHPMDLPRAQERMGGAGLAGRAALCVSAAVAASAFLILMGRPGEEGRAARPGQGLEDVLFKTGARMLEGDNFEAALNGSGQELEGEVAETVRRLSLGAAVAGDGFERAAGGRVRLRADGNVIEGLGIVRAAAQKDEASAGMLAMDLAAYIKDLKDLESALKNRLRPTISMMRMTAHVLAPVVLGVTLSIYVSLSAIAGGGGTLRAEELLVILGLFLAEVNACVCYFVWGIEGNQAKDGLMRSVGTCVLVSELIYTATVVVAA